MKYSDHPCWEKSSHNVFGVQYGRTGDTPYHYDGISEYHCTTCEKRIGRWCGKKLAEDEVEPPFCEGGDHPRPSPRI
jgi:hypothetical protein